ncbi:isoamylase early set domain-containing protein [Streptomyces sp. NPDC048255]|uniref:isoamylase early set domain-containing protein n=1 Tax=Streptomyces TaxID=1883 RepID=UPI0033DEB9C2
MLERKRRKGGKDHTEITFVLPADNPPGPVSVVGDFNDWQPGTHELQPRKDGTRAVTVALPGKSTHAFRYLAAGDYWFNEEGADAVDGSNSLLRT